MRSRFDTCNCAKSGKIFILISANLYFKKIPRIGVHEKSKKVIR